MQTRRCGREAGKRALSRGVRRSLKTQTPGQQLQRILINAVQMDTRCRKWLTRRYNIPMPYGDSLRNARGPTRVHQTTQILWLRRHRIDGILLTQSPQMLQRHDSDARIRVLQGLYVLVVDLVLVVVDDPSQLRRFLQRLDKFAEQVWVDEDGFRTTLYNGHLEPFFAEGCVRSHDRHRLRDRACDDAK